MQKVVFLVDMNAFFISCETIRHPEIKGKPAAVAGDPKNRSGIIFTSNYEARKFGVKTTMTLNEALKLCPSIIFIPPDHKFYEQKSKEVMKILSAYTPIVEQNSIDEAWLDMTGCEKIFGTPFTTAKKIMDEINKKLGLWCSIGISENKFLSKMASEIKKPMGITELYIKDIKIKLWPLPIRSMYGIGKQTTQKLQSIGIETIGDLALFDIDLLVKRFGKMGTEIHQLANGIDISQVKPHIQDEMKSIGKSTTLSKDITDFEYAKIILMQLSDEVGMAARNYGKKGHTVQITIKYSNFKTITRQITIPATYLVKDIYTAGIELLKKNWDAKMPIRLLGVTLCGFNEEAEQISMFNSLKTDDSLNNKDKVDKIENAINEIRQKYGDSIINRAIMLENKDKK